MDGLIGSYSKFIIKFIRKFQFSKLVEPFNTPTIVNESSSGSAFSPTSGVVSHYIYFNHSREYIMISHCYFNLNFPAD